LTVDLASAEVHKDGAGYHLPQASALPISRGHVPKNERELRAVTEARRRSAGA